MNMLSDLVNTVVLAVFIFVVFNLVIAHIVVPYLKRKLARIEAEEAVVVRRMIMPVDVEMIGSQYYCYNDDTKEFLCQGSSLQEISEIFVQRYPGMIGELYSSDSTVITNLRKDSVP
jgi:hypothetical protein